MENNFVFPLDVYIQGTECKDTLTGCWDIGAIGNIHLVKVDSRYSEYQSVLNAGFAMASFLTTGHRVVFFSDKLLEYFKSEFVYAILLHEIGHHVLNHMSFEETYNHPKGTILIVNESEADNFAIQYLGRETVRQAIIEMTAKLFDFSLFRAILFLTRLDKKRIRNLFGK